MRLKLQLIPVINDKEIVVGMELSGSSLGLLICRRDRDDAVGGVEGSELLKGQDHLATPIYASKLIKNVSNSLRFFLADPPTSSAEYIRE